MSLECLPDDIIITCLPDDMIITCLPDDMIITCLPDDLLLLICTYLDVIDLIRLNQITKFNKLFAETFTNKPIQLKYEYSILNISKYPPLVPKYKWLPLYARIENNKIAFTPYIKHIKYVSYHGSVYKKFDSSMTQAIIIRRDTYRQMVILANAYKHDKIRIKSTTLNMHNCDKYISNIKSIHISGNDFKAKQYTIPKFKQLNEIKCEYMILSNIDNIIDVKYITFTNIEYVNISSKFTRLEHITLRHTKITDDIINSIIVTNGITLYKCTNLVNLDKLKNLTRIIIINTIMTLEIYEQIETLKKYNSELIVSINDNID